MVEVDGDPDKGEEHRNSDYNYEALRKFKAIKTMKTKLALESTGSIPVEDQGESKLLQREKAHQARKKAKRNGQQ